MNSAKNYQIGIGFLSFQRQPETVSCHIRDVLNIRHLIVVRQNNCVSLSSQILISSISVCLFRSALMSEPMVRLNNCVVIAFPPLLRDRALYLPCLLEIFAKTLYGPGLLWLRSCSVRDIGRQPQASLHRGQLPKMFGPL